MWEKLPKTWVKLTELRRVKFPQLIFSMSKDHFYRINRFNNSLEFRGILSIPHKFCVLFLEIVKHQHRDHLALNVKSLSIHYTLFSHPMSMIYFQSNKVRRAIFYYHFLCSSHLVSIFSIFIKGDKKFAHHSSPTGTS